MRTLAKIVVIGLIAAATIALWPLTLFIAVLWAFVKLVGYAFPDDEMSDETDAIDRD